MSDSNREMWGHLSPKEKEDRRKDEEIETLRRRVAELEELASAHRRTIDHCSRSKDSLTAENANMREMIEALRASDKSLQLALETSYAENAELKRQVDALREACEEFYDAVLHDRHQLAEEGMTSEQTNSVLGIYDDTIGNALPAKGEVE